MHPLDLLHQRYDSSVFQRQQLIVKDGALYSTGNPINAAAGITSWLQGMKEWAWQDEKSPSIDPKSSKDLSEKEGTGEITGRDRFLQAANLLNGRSIVEKMQKQDKLETRFVFERPLPMKEMLDEMFSGRQNGVFTLGICSTTGGGHALGMQIDPSKNTFRFFDVNSGFYQFESLEEMKEIIPDYLQEIYPSYNRGTVMQFVDLT